MKNKKIQFKAFVEKIDGKMVAVATDETVDRMGDSLKADFWDFKNFKKNPVLLWAHDYHVPPIGYVKAIWIDGKKTMFEPVFHGITQLSREVSEMFENGIMSAFSVGFLWRQDYDKSGKELAPVYELLEISAVPVPANPKALVSERAFEYDDDEKERLENWMKKEFHEIEQPGEDAAEEEQPPAPTEEKQARMEMQSLTFSKEAFKTAEEAAAWCGEHGFEKKDAVDSDAGFVVEQFPKSQCDEGTERAIDIDEGVIGNVCRIKGSADGGKGYVGVPEPFVAKFKSLSALKKQTTAAADKNASGQDRANKGREAEKAARRQAKLLRRTLQHVDRQIGLVLSKTK